MNKALILIAIIVIAALAYFSMSSKQDSQPAESTISGTLPEVEDRAESIADEVASVPSNLISSAPDNADVFFLEPGNGTTVTSPLTLKFGITGMSVVPAGQDEENAGHHHLLINMDELPPMNLPLPATEQLIHFGAGQTETTLDLEPGDYTFQLVLGNHLHIPHDPPVVSRKITVTVSE